MRLLLFHRDRSMGDATGRHLRVLIGKVYEAICRQLWRLSRRQRQSLGINMDQYGSIWIDMDQSHSTCRHDFSFIIVQAGVFFQNTQVPEELNLGPNDENVIQKGQATGITMGHD